MDELLQTKGKIKARKRDKIQKTIITDFTLYPGFAKLYLRSGAELTEGFNRGCVVAGKVCNIIGSEGQMPW